MTDEIKAKNKKYIHSRKETKIMTKTAKKVISLIITTMMILTMSSFVFAAGEPVVTIKKNDANDTSAHSYDFYQVFSAKVDDDKKLYDIAWGNGVDVDANFYTDLDHVTGFSGCTSVDDVLAVLEAAENNSAVVDAFAKFIEGKTSSTKVTAALSKTETEKNVTLTSGFGYYLVKDTITSADGNGAVSKFMLKVVNETTGIEINTKEVVPGLDKKIVGGDGDTYNQASVGDEITFELSSKVPDLRSKGYNKYCFVMNDTLSDGLTYLGTSSSNNAPVSVTVGTKTLTSSEYTYTFDSTTNSLKIVFKDFLDYGLDTDYIGKDVKVTYKAMLNENAVVTDEGNPNTANLIYSNDPSHNYTSDEPSSSDPKGKTPDKSTVTYTTGVKVEKVDKAGNPLTGAKFEIKGTSSDQVIVTKTVYTKDNTNGTYYKLKDGTYTTTAPTAQTQNKYDSSDKYVQGTQKTLETKPSTTDIQLTVDADGILVLTGLGAGDYTIEEIEAPSGYIKDGIVHTVKIDCTFDSNNKPVWTYTIDGTVTDIDTAAGEAFVKLTVENKKTSDLPETGGMGTTMFYVSGSILLACGAALIVLKKKAASANR